MGIICIKNLYDYAGLCFINYRTVEALVSRNYSSSINPPKTRLDYPGYHRFFSRAAGIFGVGRRPKPRAAKLFARVTIKT